MGIPFDKLIGAVKKGAAVKKDSDEPVRVAVFVDASASPFLVDTVREALVPQTTSALVRVSRLDPAHIEVKPDTDVSIVLTCGSEGLEAATQKVVVGGAPTVVVAESSVEAPFISVDTPMLGLVAATDAGYLREALARWILDHTEKDTAFAANFPFMRGAAANGVITSTAITNLATGAIEFIPGADFPVMTLAQLGMMLQLAMVYDKPLRPERGYEAAGVVLSGLVLRAVTRQLVKPVGRAGFLVKALVGGFGTYAMGQVLSEVYERDVDYTALNEALGKAVRMVRDLYGSASGAGEASTADQAV